MPAAIIVTFVGMGHHRRLQRIPEDDSPWRRLCPGGGCPEGDGWV